MANLALLDPHAVAGATDSELYNMAIAYAQAHGLNVSAAEPGVAAALHAANTGLTGRVGSVSLEGGRQVGGNALARRRDLALALSRRTTTTSVQRLLNRLLGGYGLTTGPAPAVAPVDPLAHVRGVAPPGSVRPILPHAPDFQHPDPYLGAARKLGPMRPSTARWL